MSGSHRFRRVSAWLGVTALLSHVLLAALAFPVAKAATGPEQLLDVLVICTADGAKTLVHDGGGDPQTPDEHCQVCTLLAKPVPAPVPAFAIAVFSEPVTHARAAAATSPPAGHMGLGGIGARAPPVSV